MFVKRRKNLNFNNNDLFLNHNYDKVSGLIVGQNNCDNNNDNAGNGEVLHPRNLFYIYFGLLRILILLI